MEGNKRIHAFPKGISSKVNVIARLELELAHFKAAVEHFNHCTKLFLVIILTKYIKDITISARKAEWASRV